MTRLHYADHRVSEKTPRGWGRRPSVRPAISAVLFGDIAAGALAATGRNNDGGYQTCHREPVMECVAPIDPGWL